MEEIFNTWFIIYFLALSWERCNFASWSLPVPFLHWTNNKNDQANGNGHSFVKLPRPVPKIYIPSTTKAQMNLAPFCFCANWADLPIIAPSQAELSFMDPEEWSFLSTCQTISQLLLYLEHISLARLGSLISR